MHFSIITPNRARWFGNSKYCGWGWKNVKDSLKRWGPNIGKLFPPGAIFVFRLLFNIPPIRFKPKNIEFTVILPHLYWFCFFWDESSQCFLGWPWTYGSPEHRLQVYTTMPGFIALCSHFLTALQLGYF